MKSFPLPGAVPRYGPDKVVDVEHIDLYLAPDLAAQRMEGVCTTTVRAIEDGVALVTLDAMDFVIGWVRDDEGGALRFERTPGKLVVYLGHPLAAAERTTFAIAYRVERPRAGLHFITPTTDRPDRPTQCWTQSQDEFARFWFPCFDFPNAKSSTSTTIVVPTGTFALGNGKLVERRDDPATGYTTFRYQQDLPHSTYLVTMVAGAFSEVRQNGASVPIAYYVRPGCEADGGRSFGKTPQMMTFFEDRTGMRYPYARYSQIAVADFIFGGMENTTATTQTDRTLHDARAHLDFSSDPLVAHELAHQWFGDLLTTRDWSHAWLNEGFATFFDTLFLEHDLGRDEYLYGMFENVKTYLHEARDRYARPIVENRFYSPSEVFDRHLYQKGAAVLHHLRVTLGDERFWSAIRQYVRANAGGSVETIDLVRAVEAATGRNTRAFFDQWVFRGGHPELRVAYAYDRTTHSATLRVEQRQHIDVEHPPFAFDLEVGFLDALPAALERDAGADALAFERRHTLRVEAAAQTFTFVCEHPPALVRVDPNASIVGTVEFALGGEMLGAVLAGDASPIARIRAARALAADGAPAGFDALAAALAQDAFWGVRAEVARALGKAGSARAKEMLLASCGDPHPKVRRAVAEGLGAFRAPEAAAALMALARDDASYFVVQSALEALGKTHDPRAREILEAALGQPSWNDTVAAGAANGLAECGGREAAAAVLGATARTKSDTLRADATRALARLVAVDDDARGAVVQRLLELVDDDSFAVRRAAIHAAGTIGDKRLLSALARVTDSEVDGRLRRGALEASAAIRAGTEGSARVGELEAQLEALRAETRSLRDRLTTH